MTGPTESVIAIEAVRVPLVRNSFGVLAPLGHDIESDRLRHPITLWSDGTLISGARRLRCHFLLAGGPGKGRFRQIPAVFIDTIEDAAKRLLADSQDDHLALPMKPTEMCRLWEVLRKLDAPAAARRSDAARRRGVELRRQAMRGDRRPGRSSYSTDYVLDTLAEAFGMSGATAARLYRLYDLSRSEDPRAEEARRALLSVDDGLASISGAYDRVISGRSAPVPVRPKKEADPIPAAPPSKQLAAWGRVLPQMSGLVAGLVALGPPADGLTWDQVGPVHAQLSAIRRDLEKMIKQMKESAE